nr:isoform 1 of protein suppressor of npr1-1, constitutive 1 [Quercus suber]
MENVEILKDWVRVSLTRRRPEPSLLLISRIGFLLTPIRRIFKTTQVKSGIKSSAISRKWKSSPNPVLSLQISDWILHIFKTTQVRSIFLMALVDMETDSSSFPSSSSAAARWNYDNSRYETEDIKDIMGWISLHLKYDAFPYITRDLRSRLWNYEDIENMLKKNKGAEAVQAMHILRNYDDDEEIKETYELVMLRLPKSKIEQLWIGQKNFDKLKFIDLSESGLIISPDFTGVLNLEKLRLSYCKNLRELHPSVGILKKLVLLHLNSCENLMCLPNTICRLKSLECLDLSWCPNIDNLPENLGNLKGLKKLDLTKTAIKELPPSIEGLATLTLLSLRFNKNLVRLPSTICSLNSLEHLDLCGCSNFDNLPENLGNLKGLKKLDLSGTTIKEFPLSIEGLTTLHSLILKDCKNLVCLPSTVCSLSSLQHLNLCECSNFDNLPENLGNLKGLYDLDLRGTAIKEFSSSIEGLTTLNSFILKDCKNLVCLPSTICNLSSLQRLNFCGCLYFENLPENLGNLKGLYDLDLSETAIKEFPSSIEGLTALNSLTLKDCTNLVCLPSTICSLNSLERLNLCGCSNFDNLPENLGNLKGLYHLDLSGTAIKEFSSSIECLMTLTLLTLIECKNLVCLPSTVCSLSSLQRLNLCGCSNFANLPENLGNLKGLCDLDLSGTAIKEFSSSIDGLTTLNSLTLKDCKNLVCLPSSICSLSSLKCLNLCGCSNFDNLPENLGNLKGLYHLDLSGTAIKEFSSSIECLMTLTLLTLIECKNLVCLPSTVCSLSSLQRLNLCGCSNFANLPENLGNLKGLCDLDLSGTAIKEFSSSIDGLTTLNSLTLKDCKNLVCLPSSICSLSSLKCLNLCGCSNFDNLPENLGNLKGLYFLDLSGTAVKEFPSSIEGLTALNSLTLRDCKNLLCFPSTICSFSSLQRLDLCGCSNFDNLPENLGNLKGLYYLDLSGTAVKEFPSSIEGLTALISLTLRDCKNLLCFPSTICSFSSLQRLDLCGCSNFDNLPKNLGSLKGLYYLDLSGTAVKEFPSSIEGLTALISLTLKDCKNLVCLPSTICSLSSLQRLDLCGCSNFDNLPENLGNLKGLYYLDLSGTAVKEFSSSIECLMTLTLLTLIECKNLVCLPSTVCSLSSLQRLNLCGCSNFANLPENLGNLKGLCDLDLSGTAIKEFSSSIDGLTTLNSLTLKDCKNLVCLPSSICSLSSLKCLNLCGCSNFDNLPENLGNLKGLYFLDLSGTAVKEFPSSIEGLTALISLTLRDCKNLLCFPSTICSFSSLQRLDLCGCSNFDNLPKNLGSLKGLYYLDLSGTAVKEFPSSIEGLTALISLTLKDCKNLVCLPSTICSLSSLQRLDLCGCSNFDNLPENLGNLKGLYYLDLSGTAVKEFSSSIEGLTTLNSLTLKDCKNLVCLPSTICSLSSLQRLNLCRCSNFDNLPENLGNLKGLYYLDLSGTAVKEVSSSIEGLTTLNSLTLKDCKNLVCLPSTICSLSSLQRLNLCGCSNFDNLPENLGNLKGLYYLDLSGTTVKEVSSSIEGLTTLNSLTLKDCKNLVCLPSTICSLSSLQRLNLCGCSNFDNLPENLGNLKGLYYLDLSGTVVKEFHGALDLSTCSRFKNLPENPWMIEGLGMLDLSKTAIEEMSLSIGCLTNLTALTLRYCINLVHLPSTICRLKLLKSLDLFGCLKFDNLPEIVGNMGGLELLNLCWTAVKEVPSSIVLLKNLKLLHIHGWKLSEFYSQPASPESMEPLWISLSYLPTSPTMERILLPSFIYSSLQTSPVPVGLSLPSLSDDCTSLERLPELQFYLFRSDRTYLQFLFFNCFKLVDNNMLQGVNNMLQGQSGTLPKKLKIIIPGSEIPKCFNHEYTVAKEQKSNGKAPVMNDKEKGLNLESV